MDFKTIQTIKMLEEEKATLSKIPDDFYIQCREQFGGHKDGRKQDISCIKTIWKLRTEKICFFATITKDPENMISLEEELLHALRQSISKFQNRVRIRGG